MIFTSGLPDSKFLIEYCVDKGGNNHSHKFIFLIFKTKYTYECVSAVLYI